MFQSVIASKRRQRLIVLIFVGGMVVSCGAMRAALGQPTSQRPPDPEIKVPVGASQSTTAAVGASGQATPSIGARFEVRVGYAGMWKQGQICPIQIVPRDARLPAGQAWTTEVSTVDGDGVPVTYRQPLNFAAPKDQDRPTAWVSIRIGRLEAPLEVRLLTGGQVVESVLVSPEQQGTGLPASQPLIVALGSSLGVEKTSRTAASGNGNPNFSVALLPSASEIPDTWQAYLGCDLIVIPCRDHALLRSVGAGQWRAVRDWIRQGGNCVISLGPGSEALRDLAPLMELLPGTIDGTVQRCNPGPLESFVSTDTPLPRFGSCLLRVNRGVVDLSLLDDSNKRFAWWLRYSIGLGYVQLLASDLGDSAFQEWKDYRTLWVRILSTCWEHGAQSAGNSTNIGNSSFLGYEDVVGQLRATLDFFSSARALSFGQLAAILLLILILLGPVDYFVCVRWLNRPSWSWLFAAIVVASSSAGLIWAHQWFRTQEVMVNSLEVLDVDAEYGLARGLVWSHVYRASASRNDLRYVMPQQSALAQSIVRHDWLGLPGRGLGGMESTITTDRGLPGYHVEIGEDSYGVMRGVTIPSAGTKSLQTICLAEMPISSQSNLREPRGVDQLEGTLVNPLPFDLLDGVLVYRNWFYRLATRIPPGQAIEITYDMVPKDLPRWLNRRRAVNGSEQATRWDPADRETPDRLMEILLFHKAAGGSTYTSLENRFQPHVDLSKLIALDRAILFGRMEHPLGKLTVGQPDQPMSVDGFSRAWCRVILPVAQTNRR